MSKRWRENNETISVIWWEDCHGKTLASLKKRQDVLIARFMYIRHNCHRFYIWLCKKIGQLFSISKSTRLTCLNFLEPTIMDLAFRMRDLSTYLRKTCHWLGQIWATTGETPSLTFCLMSRPFRFVCFVSWWQSTWSESVLLCLSIWEVTTGTSEPMLLLSTQRDVDWPKFCLTFWFTASFAEAK